MRRRAAASVDVRSVPDWVLNFVPADWPDDGDHTFEYEGWPTFWSYRRWHQAADAWVRTELPGLPGVDCQLLIAERERRGFPHWRAVGREAAAQ